MPRLNDETLKRLKDEAWINREAGDSQLATALDLLLEWYERQQEIGSDVVEAAPATTDLHDCALCDELADALEGIIPMAEAYVSIHHDKYGNDIASLDAARAALAKARGGSDDHS